MYFPISAREEIFKFSISAADKTSTGEDSIVLSFY